MLINNNKRNSSSNSKQWKKLLGCPSLYLPSLVPSLFLLYVPVKDGGGWAYEYILSKSDCTDEIQNSESILPFLLRFVVVVVFVGGGKDLFFPSSFPYFSLVTKWKTKKRETKYCIYSLWGFCVCVCFKAK